MAALATAYTPEHIKPIEIGSKAFCTARRQGLSPMRTQIRPTVKHKMLEGKKNDSKTVSAPAKPAS